MLLISDANILIDMQVAGLIVELFRLPEVFAVPDILFVEELADHHPELPARGLKVLPLDPEAIDESLRLRARYPHASQNDLFALVLAKEQKCPLLTGDKRLCNAATGEGVQVYGTLWLMGRLFAKSLIDLERMRDAYRQMRHEGRRLPWDDVAAQIRDLSENQKGTAPT
jgi:predicted nucleic acid-binding protein